MTAPKIYVPAPGRPPEWVVDLMVEGRVHKHHDGKLWLVARETSQCRQRGWWPVDGGQAIRLNEDGSLEIIDAPKEEPEPTFTKSEVVEAMNAEAKKWPNVAMVQVALRQLAGSLNFEWGWSK